MIIKFIRLINSMNIKKILIWVGVIFLVIILLGIIKNIRNNPQTDDDDQTTPYLDSGDYDFTLEHDGLERKYLLHVPQSYKGDSTPIILAFHGGMGSAKSMTENYDLDRKSTRLNSSHTDISRMPSSA